MPKTRICSCPDCGCREERVQQMLCEMCRQSKKKYGVCQGRQMRPRGSDPLDWYLDPSRIDFIPETGCWISHCAKDTKGYPLLTTTVGTKKRMRKLGHLVLERKSGPKPDGMVICHACHTPACINPDHLRWDTQKANILDMVRAGRHGKSKLTAEHVREIRKLHESGWTGQKLAQEYGMDDSSISNIVRRVTWQHV